MKNSWRKIAIMVSIASFWACAEEPYHSPGVRRVRSNHSGQALRPINSCPDLEQSVKASLEERMRTELEANRQRALETVRQGESPCYIYDDMDRSPGMVSTSVPEDGNSNSEKAGEYSTTNNQVEGVDEADFIKNDGANIYMISGDRLLILNAWPAEQTHIIANVQLEGTPTKLFVEDDRAVIYQLVGESTACGYAGDAATQISVYDIANRQSPVLERELLLNGVYVDARRIGAAIHTVVSFPDRSQLMLQTTPENMYYWQLCGEGNVSEEDVNVAFDALILVNQEKIDALTLADILPSAHDKNYANGQLLSESSGLFAECQGFYEPNATTSGFLSVVSLALDNDSTLNAATILGQAGTVYASTENLYVAVLGYVESTDSTDAQTPDWYGRSEETSIHKFALTTDASASYAASGKIAGRLLNQFAMDEYAGDLRVAATEGYLPDPNTTNAVYVLRETLVYSDVLRDCASVDCDQPSLSAELAVVGSVKDIAKDEDIRSVRFDGDRGFMVTFKKTDPLFAFDLSDPTAPKITGELKIPGFSTYMHFMDKDHVLAIGFDADDQGSFAWFQGIQLQIFDVSNMSQPTLLHKELIGSRGTTSDATSDHLAFNFFKSKGLLALPMGICEDGAGGGSYGTRMTFNGLMVYRVSVEEGFTSLGGVDHRESVDPEYADCYNWWQNPNSEVKRSVFMDDFVYSISPARLKVNAVSALNSSLVTLALPQAAEIETSCEMNY